MESTAMGLLAGINAHRLANGLPMVVPPPTTAIGALVHHIAHTQAAPFQPMNINFGLFPPVKGRGRRRRQLQASRALEDLKRWKGEALHP